MIICYVWICWLYKNNCNYSLA